MAVFLSEADVVDLLPMERALARVEMSLLAQHRGRGVNRSRERILLPQASLHYMAASLPEEHSLGMKIYTVTPRGFQFIVLLYDTESGRLLSLMEADQLGRIRTGAASGVATKFMARPEAARIGLIGTGRQARTQLEAVAKVRNLAAVKVYSRGEEHRKDFCRAMSGALSLAVEPAASAREAVRLADIVIVATNAREPVIRGEWLEPGTHVNAIGANMANRREVDAATLARAAVIAVDSLEQSQEESGDLIQGLAELGRGWQGVIELHEIVAGACPGRPDREAITLFKSNGIALWDVSVAAEVYRQALNHSRGRELELGPG